MPLSNIATQGNHNPSLHWVGFVIAGVLAVGLGIFIYYYIKLHQATQITTCQGTLVGNTCQCSPKTPNTCKVSDDVYAHCAANGTCSCDCSSKPQNACKESGDYAHCASNGTCTTSCQKSCPPSELHWDEDKEVCTPDGDWSHTTCPTNCKIPGDKCPRGWFGDLGTYSQYTTDKTCYTQLNITGGNAKKLCQSVIGWTFLNKNEKPTCVKG